MITDAQRFGFYFPAWNRCAKANGWTMRKGRLVADPQSNPLVPELAKVWTFALQIAAREHRAVVDKDLRHACHIVAIGRDKSSDDLNTKELNRIVPLLDMLADPDDIKARMRWENPELAEKEKLQFAIRKLAPDAYIVKMSQDIFGTQYWEDLDPKKLNWLMRKLKDRSPTWNKPRPRTFTPKPKSFTQPAPGNFPKLQYIIKKGPPKELDPNNAPY